MSRGSGPRTAWPRTSTVPELGSIRPPMMLRSVLLPQPLGPMRHNSSPRATSSEVSASARTKRRSPSSPNRWKTPRILIATSAVAIAPPTQSILWQKGLGVERAHVRLFGKQSHLHKRTRQHVECFGVKATGRVEDRHQFLVIGGGDGP